MSWLLDEDRMDGFHRLMGTEKLNMRRIYSRPHFFKLEYQLRSLMF